MLTLNSIVLKDYILTRKQLHADVSILHDEIQFQLYETHFLISETEFQLYGISFLISEIVFRL